VAPTPFRSVASHPPSHPVPEPRRPRQRGRHPHPPRRRLRPAALRPRARGAAGRAPALMIAVGGADVQSGCAIAPRTPILRPSATERDRVRPSAT